MTNVSKKSLDSKTQKQLFSQFTRVFQAAGDQQLAQLFEAIFTESEKIMFVKRLAIILLLAKGESTYGIAKMLQVSDSTVREIRLKFEVGNYDSIVTVTKKRTFNAEQFWKTLETILQAGLPPRGKGRWKWLYEEKF